MWYYADVCSCVLVLLSADIVLHSTGRASMLSIDSAANVNVTKDYTTLQGEGEGESESESERAPF